MCKNSNNCRIMDDFALFIRKVYDDWPVLSFWFIMFAGGRPALSSAVMKSMSGATWLKNCL